MSILDDVPQIVADATSELLFRDAVLLRDPKGTGPAWDPGQGGAPQQWPCRALVTEWSNNTIAKGLVASEDRKVLILAVTLRGVTPKEGDRILVQGNTYRVSSDGGSAPAVRSDPANATWTCRGRN